MKKFKLSRRPRGRHYAGAALVEYGLLAGLVVVGSIAAVSTTGDEVREIFCKASNGIAGIAGNPIDPSCVNDPSRPFELGEDERYVDTPVEMAASFEDVLYANSVTGERLLMSKIAGEPASKFWLDTAIISRDAYEPNRPISSCYLLGEGTDPICSLEGPNAAISVPANASAIGYLVSLNENTQMPWVNDVMISVPAGEGVDAQSWAIEVAREDAEPVFDITFDFDDLTYGQADTGWQDIVWADVTGDVNVDTSFILRPPKGSPLTMRACYRMAPASPAECSDENSHGHAYVGIAVPPGVSQVGIMPHLPDVTVGDDHVTSLDIDLVKRDDSAQSFGDSIVVMRPNETAVRNASFDLLDHTFAQTEAGWTYVPFAALTGEYNAPYWLALDRDAGDYSLRRVCYAMEAGGDPVCSNESEDGDSSVGIELPLGAAEVGMMLELPAVYVGDDWSTQHVIKLLDSRGGSVYFADAATATRPSEPAVRNASFDLEDHTFAQSDTGWSYVPFAELSGDYNTPYWLRLDRAGGGQSLRMVCYTMELGGDPVCSSVSSSVSNPVGIELPLGAVEVGMMLDLPPAAKGNDWVTTHEITLRDPSSKNGSSYFSDTVTTTRSNEPIIRNASFDVVDHTFDQTDTGWMYVPFAKVEGEYTEPYWLRADWITGGQGLRMVCYTMEVGGAPVCSNVSSSGTNPVGIEMPLGAAEVGLMLNLPGETMGDDWVAEHKVTLRHLDRKDGSSYFSDTTTTARPNEPILREARFEAKNHAFTETDSGWTYASFAEIQGEYNVPLWLRLDAYIGNATYQAICYTMEIDGEPTCKYDDRGWNRAVGIELPVGAAEIGYMLELPDEGVDSSWETTKKISLQKDTSSSSVFFFEYTTATGPTAE